MVGVFSLYAIASVTDQDRVAERKNYCVLLLALPQRFCINLASHISIATDCSRGKNLANQNEKLRTLNKETRPIFAALTSHNLRNFSTHHFTILGQTKIKWNAFYDATGSHFYYSTDRTVEPIRARSMT